MTAILPQIWKGAPFTIERNQGTAPGTVILRMAGPFTARDMYSALSPGALREMFEFQPGVEPPGLNIVDLSAVPYVDSMGLGILVSFFARCQNKGVRMVAAGVGPRVLQLFEITKVDAVIPRAATVADAEALA